jgi:hypothetical protein
LAAGLLKARHHALSLADCFLLAIADPDHTIATADRALLAAARYEGIVMPLPDAAGRTY